MNIKKIIGFFRHDMWHIKRDEVSPLAFFAVGVLKKLYISIEFFTTRRVIDMASALTYSTLLAIVPIFAVVFAIARGFGYNKYIELWFRESLSSQPQAADTIIAFVNSYLVHTKSGVFFGVGLVFMLFTVLMLTANVEKTFNSIWQVKHPRSVYRAVTDYLAMLFLVPIVIVVTSGVSIVVATLAGQTNNYIVLGSVMRVTVDVLPYVLMSVVFMGLYLFMPNTKVRFSVVVIPGILAGIAMQVLQLFYIHAQIFLSSYNAIYGSFAALPLFMLWLNISWCICLVGGQLSYANQCLDNYAFQRYSDDLSRRYRDTICLLLMSRIAKRFASGGTPYSDRTLAEDTRLPQTVVFNLLQELVKMQLLAETRSESSSTTHYLPAIDIRHLTVRMVTRRIESYGVENPQHTWRAKPSEWEELRRLRNTNEDALLTDV